MANEDTNTNLRDLGAATPPPTHNSDDSEDCCVICLEDVSEPCELAPCGHCNFDVGCIGSWLAVSRRCPLCKALVDRIIRGPRGLPGRPVHEIRCPAEILAASLWPRSTSSPDSSSSRRRRRPRYTPADFAAAGAAYARLMRPAPAPTPTPTPTTTSTDIQHRREVYLQGLFSLHVDSDPILGYRDVTAALFRREPQLTTRARAFLQRELRVFDYVPAERTAFLIDQVVTVLGNSGITGDTWDNEAAGALQTLLAADLGRSAARLLLHELRAWLRSPYASLRDWDMVVRYPRLDQWTARAEVQDRRRERELMEGLQRQRERIGGGYKFNIWLPNIRHGLRASRHGQPSRVGGFSTDFVYANAFSAHYVQPFPTHRHQQ
ncbi:hypothetical protein MY10362_007454 [Beauveria mimosiformis]